MNNSSIEKIKIYIFKKLHDFVHVKASDFKKGQIDAYRDVLETIKQEEKDINKYERATFFDE